ncbi:alpha/beta-hydrolase [Meira miltonrushii]|uniref:Prolyl endopeptidase n=1 Tax=Meira miltonrushii TaxID=1280837 RepID=A0A316V9T0_9BASI|nr:alpha/beta-hydrolase [Meira miltonrushii]PWN33211.1 alpha/beta-hydrolase [Meira miltonrushii]
MKGCKNKDTIVESLLEASNYDNYRYVKLISLNIGASVTEFQAAKKTNFATLPGRLFLNESLLSSDGSASIGLVTVSPNGEIFSYQVLEGGVNSIWHPTIRHHVWGTDNAQDVTLFDSKNAGEYGEDCYFYMELSSDRVALTTDFILFRDGRWLMIAGYNDVSTLNTVAYATRLAGQQISNNMKWISLAPGFDFTGFSGGVVNDTYYFWTNKDAKNGKVAKINLDWSKARQVKNFTELQDRPPVIDVVPERKDALINAGDVKMTAKDKLLVNYIEQGEIAIYLYNTKDGKLIKRLLPNETMYVNGFRGDPDSNTMIILAQSWNTPSKVFEFDWTGSDMETSTITVRHIQHSNPDDFAIEKHHAASKDGTQVPYFVTYRKGIQKPAPVFLHAYGAYGDIENLFYQPNYFDFLRNYDGFFVWGGPRGGGDKGGFWHDAGSGLNKEHTFKDIITIIKDLIALKYGIPGKFIIEGGSAGGIAMAAVANQAPASMVGLALPVRATCDVFELELRTTVGDANKPEFGDVTTPEGFDAVRAWSPLQNVVPNKPYPAIFLTPGSYDETVVPSSSYKFVAELQHTNPNNALPFLMYVVQDKGHVPSTIIESSYQFYIMEEALHITRRKS